MVSAREYFDRSGSAVEAQITPSPRAVAVDRGNRTGRDDPPGVVDALCFSGTSVGGCFTPSRATTR